MLLGHLMQQKALRGTEQRSCGGGQARAPLGTHQGGSPLKSRVGAKGLLSGDGARGKEYNEDDDDKDNDTDDDNHLHILPPELPGHLLGCRLEVFRRGFQVLGLVSEVVQVFPSGQDPLHILGHNILDPLHLALQVPDPVISGTPTALLLDVNTGAN